MTSQVVVIVLAVAGTLAAVGVAGLVLVVLEINKEVQ
jgi:hypothetical protein